MDEFAVGDKVEVGAWVADHWVAFRSGIVVGVHAGCCEVDVAGPNGSQACVLKERYGSMRKLPGGWSAQAATRRAA